MPRERERPTEPECIEALQVMLENYGYNRVLNMLGEANDLLRDEAEQLAGLDKEEDSHRAKEED